MTPFSLSLTHTLSMSFCNILRMYPHVFHVPTGNRLAMQSGITFTIEPMITLGAASPPFPRIFQPLSPPQVTCDV